MNFKNYRKYLVFGVLVWILFSAGSEKLLAMNGCNDWIQILLSKQTGAQVAVNAMPALKEKRLSNGATFSLIHGDLEDATKQVWRDDSTILAWSPVATTEELAEIQRKNKFAYILHGTEHADFWMVAKTYCESLVIPGMESIKWALPEARDFLKAASNAAQNMQNQSNKNLIEAFPDMEGQWFWSSPPLPINSSNALIFSGYNGKIDYGFRGTGYGSVRCVSRSAP